MVATKSSILVSCCVLCKALLYHYIYIYIYLYCTDTETEFIIMCIIVTTLCKNFAHKKGDVSNGHEPAQY